MKMDEENPNGIWKTLLVLKKQRKTTAAALEELASDMRIYQTAQKLTLGLGGFPVFAIAGVVLGTLMFATGFTAFIIGVVASKGVLFSSVTLALILKDKTLAKAKDEIDSFVAVKVRLLTLLDRIMEQNEFRFYRLVETCIKKTDPLLYNEIVDVVMDEDTGNNTESGRSFLEMFLAAGMAAGRVPTEAPITSGTVLAAVSSSLDVVTIIKNSISIHKKSPAEAAEIVRNMVKHIEKGNDPVDVENDQRFKAKVHRLRCEQQTLEIQMLQREIEEQDKEMERLKRIARQQWSGELTKLGTDNLKEMEVLSMEFDSIRTMSLKVNLFLLLTHVLLSFILFLTEVLFRGKSEWLSYFIGLGVIYDTFLLMSVLGTLFMQKRVICKVTTTLEANRMTANRLCRVAPVDVLSPELHLDFDPVNLTIGCTARFVMQTCLTALELVLTLSALFRYRHMGRTFDTFWSYLLSEAPTLGFMLLDGPVSILAGDMGFVQYPLEESFSAANEGMETCWTVMTILIWMFLTVSFVVELKWPPASEMSRSIVSFGHVFKTRLDNISECVESNENN